jgi:hypothetical protein
MSIEAIKQAVKALEYAAGLISPITKGCQCQICLAHTALRQAIAEAEKQEPVAVLKNQLASAIKNERHNNLAETRYWCDQYKLLAEKFSKIAPVHAIDISQERVDETAKREHEPVAWREVAGKTTKYYDYNEQGRGEPLYAAPQPDLARVGEVGVWGDKREWVGLTDEEVEAIYDQEGRADVVLLTQAKLKEKNCG